jgi:hypothetical protein
MARLWDISGDDIETWAQRVDAPSELPDLVRRLLLATTPLKALNMRADGGVWLGGWDGTVLAEMGTEYCPQGPSVWELTTRKTTRAKLDEDFTKRVVKALPNVRREGVAYVVVTAHRFAGEKQEWASEKSKQNVFREVRVYDADDLASWLTLAPAVARWFGAKLGRPAYDLSDLDAFAVEWGTRTQPPLPLQLTLVGRERERAAEAVREWSRGARPSHLFVRADTRDEAVAFSAAALSHTPGQEGASLRARTLVVENREALRWVQRSSKGEPLILLPSFEEFEPKQASNSNFVVIPLTGAEPAISSSSQEIRLEPVPYRRLEEALLSLGIPETEAKRRAEESGGKLAALQRSFGYAAPPPWVSRFDRTQLAIMALISAWQPENEADRSVVRAFGTEPSDLQKLCEELALVADAATVKDTERWGKMTWAFGAPGDVWRAIIGSMPADILRRFVDVVLEVLGKEDPRYELSSDERFYAPLHGKTIKESARLREGLALAVARLSQSDELLASLHGPAAGSRIAVATVGRLLQPPWLTWASVSEVLPILAEAAPDTFLSRLEESLTRGDAGVEHLLAEEGQYAHPHTGLLWALETLAWSHLHMPRVVRALAKLAERDASLNEREGRMASRPSASLARILHPLRPQTLASMHDRINLVRALLAEGGPSADVVTYPLVLAALRSVGQPGMMLPHRLPQFSTEKMLSEEEQERRAASEMRPMLEAMVDLAVEHAGVDADKWIALLPSMVSVSDSASSRSLAKLDEKRRQIDDSRGQLWLALLFQAAKARENESRRDSLAQRFQQAADAFEPSDFLLKLELLFGPSAEVMLPNLPPASQFQERAREVLDRLQERAREVLERRREGLNSIWQLEDHWVLLENLMRRASDASSLGYALAHSEFAPQLDSRLFGHDFNAAYTSILKPYALGRWQALGKDERITWAEQSLRALMEASRLADATLWDFLEEVGDPLRASYWGSFKRTFDEEVSNPDYWERAIENLLEVANVEAAFVAVGSSAERVTPSTAARVLDALLKDASLRQRLAGQSMTSYWFDQILKRIEGAADVDGELRIQGEVAYAFMAHQSDRRGKIRAILTDEFTKKPDWFADLVSQIYRREGEEGSNSEEGHERAEQAHHVLSIWRGYPGEGAPHAERESIIYAWALKALRLTREQGRPAVGTIEVSKVLARAPAASDGHWPCLAARCLLKLGEFPRLGDYLALAKRNLRGLVTRKIGKGGNQERAIAQGFRAAADAMRVEWTEASAVVYGLAEAYENEAKVVDAEAVTTLRQEGLERDEDERPQGSPPSPLPPPPAASFVTDRVVVLRSAQLHNVGAFETLQIGFSPPEPGQGQWVVLLGENGTGKTTLLRALAFAMGGANITAAALATLPSSIVKFGASEGVCIVESDSNVTCSMTVKEGVSREVGQFSPGHEAPRPLIFAYGCRRGSALGGTEPTQSETTFSNVATLFDEHARVLPARGRLRDLWVRSRGSLRDQVGVHENIYQQVVTKLCQLLPDDVIRIEVDADDVWAIGAKLGERVPVAALSDGYLATLGWAADLALSWLAWAHKLGVTLVGDFFQTQMCGLVLLDEIDLHLHPRWQRNVLERARRVFPKMSFVVTTHNPLTLLGAQADEIWVLRRQDNVISVERGHESPALMTSGQLYEAYFGITSLFPHELGEKLRRYGFLAGTPARTEAEEKEVYDLQEYLRSKGADPGWSPVPRELPPDFFEEAGE